MNKNIKQEKHNYKRTTLRMCLSLMIIFIITSTFITVISTIKSSGNLSFGKYKFYIMMAESKDNATKKGDLVIVKKIKSDELRIDDDIVYNNDGFYYCNRIKQTRKVNTITKLIITEGNGIKYQFNEDEIEGKIVFNIHNIGNIIIILRTVFGIILFILFIICLFLLLRMFFMQNKNCNEIKDTEDKI